MATREKARQVFDDLSIALWHGMVLRDLLRTSPQALEAAEQLLAACNDNDFLRHAIAESKGEAEADLAVA